MKSTIRIILWITDLLFVIEIGIRLFFDTSHLLICLLFLLAGIGYLIWDWKWGYYIEDSVRFGKDIAISYKGDLTVVPGEWNPSNQFQPHSSVHVTASEGKLFFLVPYSLDRSHKPYCDWLCTAEKGKLRRIIKIGRVCHIGCDAVFHDASVSTRNGKTITTLHRYSISSKAEHTLSIDGDLRDLWNLSDSCLVAAVDGTGDRYMLVSDGYRAKADYHTRGYAVGGKIYCLEYTEDFLGKLLVSYDEMGNREVLTSPGSDLNLIPWEKGILVHNYSGDGSILSLLNEETYGLRELFRTDKSGKSALSLWGNTVYLSWNSRENRDESEGLWRIDLIGGTKEKISARAYCGLYIFDDSGIFACSEAGEFYKVDFDGEELYQIL